MADFNKIATPELKAYADILENIITTGMQIKNTVNDMISRNSQGDEKEQARMMRDFDDTINPILNQVEETEVVFREIQVELDKRMMKALKLKSGIRRMQSHILKFEEKLSELADIEIAKRTAEMNKAKIYTDNDTRPPLKLN